MPELTRVMAWIRTQTWIVEPTYAQTFFSVLKQRLVAGAVPAEIARRQIEASRLDYEARHNGRVSGGGVALIPLVGSILPRVWNVQEVSGGGVTSSEGFAHAVRRADADPDVGVIVIDVDSPGGAAAGVQEAGDVVRSASKPVVAVANLMAGSAAYWIASQADELVCSPSGEVGSIGCVAVHEDWSAALEADGVKVTVITEGKNKYEGNPFEPLTDEARAEIQRTVSRIGREFDKAVARGRGVTVAHVRENFGQGRMFDAKRAKSLGMIDRVETLEQTLARVASRRPKKRVSAELPAIEPRSDAPEQPVVEPAPAPPPAPVSTSDLDLRRRELELL